ncbi:primosomal protein N' [bacterium]|nr:primosomal protein N' [bacterium]
MAVKSEQTGQNPYGGVHKAQLEIGQTEGVLYRIEVVLARPLEKPLSYLATSEQYQLLQPGCQVLVPLARTLTTGYVIQIETTPVTDDTGFKRIVAILDPEPVLSSELLHLTREVAQYYQSQWGWVIKNALPPGIQPEEIKRIKLSPSAPTQLSTMTDLAEDPLVIKLFQLLEHQQSDLTVKKVSQQLKSNESSAWPLLKKLEKRGLIELEYDVQKRSTGKKSVLYRLALQENAANQVIAFTIQRAPRKAEIMTRIVELSTKMPVFGARDLNVLKSGASRYLSDLAREGFIAPANLIEETTTSLREARPVQIDTLMDQQRDALTTICGAIADRFRVFLVHGVTGSGKTEVYLRAAEFALNKGYDVLLLVPEIGLTPAMIAYLTNRFPDRTIVLHSGLEKSERLRQWYAARERSPKLVLGTRSAVFAPLYNPGLIIVDEEHDTSFKQANNPMYNARDVAILRGYFRQFPVVLGSATPSLESFLHAQQGKYELLTMSERIDHRPLPPVSIVDMRLKHKKKRRSSIFCNDLLEAMEQRLAHGEQTLLFVPRRGYSHTILCHECGYVFMCQRCSVSMTYHKQIDQLKCHYCDRTASRPVICPECKGKELKGVGIGTQTVEEETRHFFPKARICRIDTDSIRGRNLYTIIQAIAQGQIDIIIGTQMVTKGHDFQNITLVGVLAADTTLHLPDFRAAERTFQLLTQVAGRTGRGKQGGCVLIQTLNPDHHCIQAASQHDYRAFFEKERLFRQSFRFPPYRRLAQIILSSSNQQAVIRAARAFVVLLEDHPPEIEYLGPAPAPLSLLKGKFRWQIIVKCHQAKFLGDFIRTTITRFNQNYGKSSITITVDIDPIFIL